MKNKEALELVDNIGLREHIAQGGSYEPQKHTWLLMRLSQQLEYLIDEIVEIKNVLKRENHSDDQKNWDYEQRLRENRGK